MTTTPLKSSRFQGSRLQAIANAVAKEPAAESAGSAVRKQVLHSLSSCQADDSQEHALDRARHSLAPKRDEVAPIWLQCMGGLYTRNPGVYGYSDSELYVTKASSYCNI